MVFTRHNDWRDIAWVNGLYCATIIRCHCFMRRTLHRYQSWRSCACYCVESLLISGAVMLPMVVPFSAANSATIRVLSYIPHALLITFVFQLCMYYVELYDSRVVLTNRQLFLKLLQSSAVAMVVLKVLFYLLPQLVIGRGTFLPGLASAFCCIAGWRLLYQWLQGMNQFRTNILIIGSGEEARKLARELVDNKALGYELKGFIDDDPGKLGVSIVNPKVLGNSEQLQEIVERESIDKIVVALSDRRGKLPVEALLACKLRGIEVEEGATFYERISGCIMLENLQPSWIIFSQVFALSPLVQLCKRMVDMILSFVGLVLATPLLAVSAVLIKLDSRGPILFSQPRVGQNGTLFTLRKLRSMQDDAEMLSGPVYTTEDDRRVTRVGRFLRTTRVDELPQLFNVLKGEMSFIGPRPERPFFVEQFEKEILCYTQRLSVKPGITGWAQVNYPYGSNLEDAIEKLRFDLYYIKNMSLLLDLFIILKTLKIITLGTGAR